MYGSGGGLEAVGEDVRGGFCGIGWVREGCVSIGTD